MLTPALKHLTHLTLYELRVPHVARDEWLACILLPPCLVSLTVLYLANMRWIIQALTKAVVEHLTPSCALQQLVLNPSPEYRTQLPSEDDVAQLLRVAPCLSVEFEMWTIAHAWAPARTPEEMHTRMVVTRVRGINGDEGSEVELRRCWKQSCASLRQIVAVDPKRIRLVLPQPTRSRADIDHELWRRWIPQPASVELPPKSASAGGCCVS